MAMGCIDCHDYVDGYNRGRVDGAIEKLENLEREIPKICKDFILCHRRSTLYFRMGTRFPT